MITKEPARVKPSKPKHTFGPGDHGRAITEEQAANARWIEGFRYEIIDGRIYVSPMPELPHEELKNWLLRKLLRYSDAHPQVTNRVAAPARIFLPGHRKTTVPEADIATYRDFPYSVPLDDRNWRMVSPMLVVEIVSGDVAKDLTRNVVLYERVPSIQEYWVINYWTEDDFFFRVFRKRGKRWGKPVDWKLGETYTTRLLPGFSLKLKPDV
jgi:Uma2 family endonuclease